jgi:hypothetical protein
METAQASGTMRKTTGKLGMATKQMTGRGKSAMAAFESDAEEKMSETTTKR